MDQEVMNQLSEEVLRLDTRIDNVSDDLGALENKVNSLNNDAINQRVNDIANIVDNNTSIVNSMDSRIKDLENNKQNLISARSVSRSIEISEMQEIHEEIHEVAMAVDNLDASVSPRVTTLENQASNFSSNISNLQNEDKDIRKAMNDMDVEHHEELHRLALAVDGHESRIDDIETHWFNYEGEIERLDNKIDSSISEMKGYIDNNIDASISEIKGYIYNNIDASISEMKGYIDNKMDASISEIKGYLDNKIDASITELKVYVDDVKSDIDNIQYKIDDVSTGLSNVTTIVNNLSQHIVLTQEEYDNLDNPDYNSFYFTY